MSTSDLYRVYRTKATHVAEFRNGWGTAPLLWDFLCENFLGGLKWYLGEEHSRKMWALASDERVPQSLRIAHAFTYDAAICPVSKTVALSLACDEVANTCAKAGHVNHWAALAGELRKARPKPRQLGWALSCTSVNDVWCEWKGDPKPWDIFNVLAQEASA